MQFGQDCNIINTLNKFFLGALNLTNYAIWIRLQYNYYVNRLDIVIFNPYSLFLSFFWGDISKILLNCTMGTLDEFG